MASYREATIKGKAAQRGIVEQRPIGGRSKRERPVIVEHCYLKPEPGDVLQGLFKYGVWRKWGAYRTTAEAEAMIVQQKRKYKWMDFRIRP